MDVGADGLVAPGEPAHKDHGCGRIGERAAYDLGDERSIARGWARSLGLGRYQDREVIGIHRQPLSVSGNAAVPLHAAIEFTGFAGITDGSGVVFRLIVVIGKIAANAGDDRGQLRVGHESMADAD